MCFSLTLYSQNDTIVKSIKSTNTVQDDSLILLKLYIQKFNECSLKLSQANLECDKLRSKYDSIGRIISGLEKENFRQRNEILQFDTVLFKTGINFLYIPYDSFSINSIAIPSLKRINRKENFLEFDLVYTLFSRYEVYLSNFKQYLVDKEKDHFQNPFDINSFKLDLALDDFHKQEFYSKYNEYEDFKNTYLGLKFQMVEERFRLYSEKKKVTFEDLIKELSTCLETK